MNYRTFNISFLNPFDDEDETQFDVEDGSFVEMMNELIELFNNFCDECCGGRYCRIIRVEETEYDGEK